MSQHRITIKGRAISVANLDKVIFPKDDITQGDLLDYYRRIAETMLPHLRGRPLTMQRFPNGIDAEGFYQKEAPEHFAAWIAREQIALKSRDETQPQLICNDAPSLLYLVDQGCVTFHVWQSRVERLRDPDRMVFDLDPPDDGFELVRSAARALYDALREVGLVPYLMTTGSRGIHVVAPLKGNASFDAVRTFAKDLAKLIAERSPDSFTTEMRKSERGNRLFVDYLRNAYGQTAVAPYSVRARAGAPIATPLDWEELSRGNLHAQSYSMRNIFRRLGQKKDPWQNMMRDARSLEQPRQRLDELVSSA